jgi:hypothetical protein
MELIAEFRDSFYKGEFGFTVEVYKTEGEEYIVLSNGLLDDKYENFETLLNDLIKNNPLWYTYYYVKINDKYNELIAKKLEESVDYVMDSLSRISTDNWHINNMQTKLSDSLMKRLESFKN